MSLQERKFVLARPHNWLIYTAINPALRLRLEKYAKGTLADIGCGEKPYASMAMPYIQSHIGVDHEKSLHGTDKVDVIGTAYATTLDGASCDTVLCTDVLEHLEEPIEALHEAYRILKCGGYTIYTVPLFWHLHEEPRDFFRYTKYGLRYLFEKAGFEIVEITPLTGFVVTFAQELVYFLNGIPNRGGWKFVKWLTPPASFLIQYLAYLINKFERSEIFTAEYIVVARKP